MGWRRRGRWGDGSVEDFPAVGGIPQRAFAAESARWRRNLAAPEGTPVPAREQAQVGFPNTGVERWRWGFLWR